MPRLTNISQNAQSLAALASAVQREFDYVYKIMPERLSANTTEVSTTSPVAVSAQPSGALSPTPVIPPEFTDTDRSVLVNLKRWAETVNSALSVNLATGDVTINHSLSVQTGSIITGTATHDTQDRYIGAAGLNGISLDEWHGWVISSGSNIILNIDSENNDTGRFFDIRHNANANAGALLFRFTDAGWLQFGGTSSSYPMLRGNTGTIQARLADDSAWAEVSASIFSAVSHLRAGDTNFAASGAVRLKNNESIMWRNAAASADIGVKVNASNQLEITPDLALTGKVVKYGNVATAAMGVAPILEYVFMEAYDTDQGWASFANTTTAGFYRVSVYYRNNGFDIGTSTVHVDIRWNGGGQSYTGETLTLSSGSVYKEYTKVFYHTGGANSVQYQADYTAVGGSADSFDAHLTIERLV